MASLDFYMMEYHPYRGGTNPLHTYGSDSQTLVYIKAGYAIDLQRKTNFCKRVEEWLKKEVEKLIYMTPGVEVVIAIAPGHMQCDFPSGFMHDIVGSLLASNTSLEDGRQQLIRTKTVNKQAQTPGFRGVDTHEGTIEVRNHSNMGKIVIILDDVWTSGSTLCVCKEVMLTTNPSEVKLCVIGKTV